MTNLNLPNGALTILLIFGLFISCKEQESTKEKKYIVDFNDALKPHTNIDYNPDFIRAVGLFYLFKQETKNITDVSKYIDTLTYMRNTYTVLNSSKDNYEIPILSKWGGEIYAFTRDSVYYLTRNPIEIKNYSGINRRN